MNNQPSNQRNSEQPQDSAVVYQETIFGMKGTTLQGNRRKNGLQAFEDFWTNFLTFPPNPIHLALDSAIWIFGISVSLKLTQLANLGGLLILPWGALLLGLMLAVAYNPRLRTMAFIRLALLILGTILSI